MRRREKRDSLLSTCTHTHKHVCTHTDIGMNEPIHSKHTFYWFIGLGTKSHHPNLPELSCTYQKNVSPAIPVSLFILTQVLQFLLSIYQILQTFCSPEMSRRIWAEGLRYHSHWDSPPPSEAGSASRRNDCQREEGHSLRFHFQILLRIPLSGWVGISSASKSKLPISHRALADQS